MLFPQENLVVIPALVIEEDLNIKPAVKPGDLLFDSCNSIFYKVTNDLDNPFIFNSHSIFDITNLENIH